MLVTEMYPKCNFKQLTNGGRPPWWNYCVTSQRPFQREKHHRANYQRQRASQRANQLHQLPPQQAYQRAKQLPHQRASQRAKHNRAKHPRQQTIQRASQRAKHHRAKHPRQQTIQRASQRAKHHRAKHARQQTSQRASHRAKHHRAKHPRQQTSQRTFQRSKRHQAKEYETNPDRNTDKKKMGEYYRQVVEQGHHGKDENTPIPMVALFVMHQMRQVLEIKSCSMCCQKNTSKRKDDVAFVLRTMQNVITWTTYVSTEDDRSVVISAMVDLFVKIATGIGNLFLCLLAKEEFNVLGSSSILEATVLRSEKGRLKFAFEKAAQLVLWLSHDVESNPGPFPEYIDAISKMVRELSRVMCESVGIKLGKKNNVKWALQEHEKQNIKQVWSDVVFESDWKNPSYKDKPSKEDLNNRLMKLWNALKEGGRIADGDKLDETLKQWHGRQTLYDQTEALREYFVAKSVQAAVDKMARLGNSSNINAIRKALAAQLVDQTICKEIKEKQKEATETGKSTNGKRSNADPINARSGKRRRKSPIYQDTAEQKPKPDQQEVQEIPTEFHLGNTDSEEGTTKVMTMQQKPEVFVGQTVEILSSSWAVGNADHGHAGGHVRGQVPLRPPSNMMNDIPKKVPVDLTQSTAQEADEQTEPPSHINQNTIDNNGSQGKLPTGSPRKIDPTMSAPCHVLQFWENSLTPLHPGYTDGEEGTSQVVAIQHKVVIEQISEIPNISGNVENAEYGNGSHVTVATITRSETGVAPIQIDLAHPRQLSIPGSDSPASVITLDNFDFSGFLDEENSDILDTTNYQQWDPLSNMIDMLEKATVPLAQDPNQGVDDETEPPSHPNKSQVDSSGTQDELPAGSRRGLDSTKPPSDNVQ